MDALDPLPTDPRVREFLQAALPQRNGDERIETRIKTTKGMTSRMHQHINQLTSWAAAIRDNGDIWFGAGVRAKYGGRGNESVTRLG